MNKVSGFIKEIIDRKCSIYGDEPFKGMEYELQNKFELYAKHALERELAELKAHNAVLREAFEQIQEMVDVKECDDCEIVFSNIYQAAQKAISTTPPEALEKQRKKEEIFQRSIKMLEGCINFIDITSGFKTLVEIESILTAAKKLEGE